MAEKLEAKPDRMATMEEYRAIVDDHPVKFDEKQVHFERDEGGDHKDGMCCAVCFHFYAGKFHNVCEIFRPTDGNPTIQPIDYCHFVTLDGESFPLLEE